METLGSRRSPAGGRKRSLRSPSPAPPPRPPKSTPPPPSSTNNNHTPSAKNHALKTEEEASDHRQSLPASKEVKSAKIEASRDGVKIDVSMETEQGRKVKPVSTGVNSTAVKSVASNVNDFRSAAGKNNIQRRKRERSPSPTPSSLPGTKRQASNNSTTQSTATSDATGQPSNPKMGQQPSNPKTGQQPSNPKTGQQPAIVKPLSGGANNALKPSGMARLVKPEMSSASKVLNEEIQKQQGQENARLKTLIFKEVKKQGKSECGCGCDQCVYILLWSDM